MLSLSNTILILAGLMALISMLQPMAGRLNLPNTVLLAAVGVLVALGASYLRQFGLAFEGMAEILLGVPITSAGFLYIFLPILLFQAALGIDVRRMIDDAVPIFVLAVVAVVVATAVIGLVLWPFAGVSLVVCLLLGSIVATTDPAAVVAIFRDLGAPGRLTRLVEGESLLNDATAIVLFTVLLQILLTGHQPSIGDAFGMFLMSLFGGAAAGFVIARLAMGLALTLRESRGAELTLSIAVPYLVFVVSERFLGVSGVVAVVMAGLVIGVLGRNRLAPANWRFLEEVWEQFAFLAGSLVFVLAALLVPRLLIGINWLDVGLIGLVVVASLGARALVLFGLLPLLGLAGFGQRISTPFKFVIVWGGLRGAVTLALALSITENPLIVPDVQRFVAILATGFVLFTLLVGGTTLRPVIRLLGIDRLSPFDQALRAQILTLSLDSARDSIVQIAKQYRIGSVSVDDVLKPLVRNLGDVARGDGAAEEGATAIPEADRLTMGLVALAHRERELVAEHAAGGAIARGIASRLLAETELAVDQTRSAGREGYLRAAAWRVGFSWTFRVAHLLHRLFAFDGPLERRVADRFETLMVTRIVLEELERFVGSKLSPLYGRRIAQKLREVLAERSASIVAALDALRLQYPEYAAEIERRFLTQLAVRLETAEVDGLREEALIGSELHGALKRELDAVRKAMARRPRLDLGLNTRALVEGFPMFSALSEAEREKICALLRPRLALPDELLIRRGDRGASVFFISSGAVEVDTGRASVRLGRGDFFGEMALITGQRRQADVRALGYCQLLLLEEADFRRLLVQNPSIKSRIDEVAEERLRMNLRPGDREPAG